jgi:putative FmdB family regulatory protein
MPKYNYKCSECGEEFQVYHSMLERTEKCGYCESTQLQRIPFLSFSVCKPNKAGKLVNEFIRDAKQDVEAEKQKLKEEHND